MALSTFVIIQSYLTALILVIATVLWFRIRREYEIERIKSNKIFNIVLLLTIPFIFRIIRFIPSNINTFIQHFLLLVISIALVAVAVKTFRKSDEERTKDLKELIENARGHPVKLEFARRVVEPDYKKLLDERAKISREKRAKPQKRLKKSKLN